MKTNGRNSSGRKMNILFAIADDASHFGLYGHKFVKTPCIDELGVRGIVFTQAFTTNPKCAPSRASILTGKHTWQLKEGCDHYGYFPDGFDVYPDLLEDAGYHVGFTGKGWAPGDFERCGRIRNPAGKEYNCRTLDPPEGSLITPCDYAMNFRDFLNEKPEGSPFCFWYGCHEPHRPYKYGEGKTYGGDPDEMKVPPYWPDEEQIRMDMADYCHEISWFDSQLRKILEELDKSGERKNTLVVVTSDNGAPFPRVKGQMYDDDFRLPLVIAPPEGFPVGRQVDDLVSFIDFAPTFLEAAGIDIPRALPGNSLWDILKGGDNGSSAGRREYVLMGRERHDLGRENDAGYPVRCLRTKQYLYVHNLKSERWPAGNPETGFTNCDSSPTKDRILSLHENGEEFYFELSFGKRPEEELYNIKKDPHCMENLAFTEEGREYCVQFGSVLEKSLLQSGDPRSVGVGCDFDTYDYVGDDRHSWKALMENRWKKQPF